MLDVILGEKARDAKCFNHPDPDWFHIPGTGANLKEQKKFCQDCKIITECLDYAVRNDVSGVWGGTWKLCTLCDIRYVQSVIIKKVMM